MSATRRLAVTAGVTGFATLTGAGFGALAGLEGVIFSVVAADEAPETDAYAVPAFSLADLIAVIKAGSATSFVTASVMADLRIGAMSAGTVRARRGEGAPLASPVTYEL